MKKIFIIAALIATAISCEEFKKGQDDGRQDPDASGTAQMQEIPEVLVYKLDGGKVMANNLNLFAQGDTYKGESKELAAAYYVIKHPQGTLLWDTGLPEMLVGKDSYTPEGGAFTISRQDSIKTQLDVIGMRVEDIDMIAFSHIHFDHTGAANHFSNAKWFVQEVEYNFAQGEEIKGNTFYAPDSFSTLKNVEKLNGDKDIFGDGTVVIKAMPGHTPGHQVLYLNLKNNGPTLLSGDIYHFKENREQGIVPQFNYDIPETEQSIKDFEAFAKSKNAKVIIQHDATDFASTPSKLD